jgi:hypothetical protein
VKLLRSGAIGERELPNAAKLLRRFDLETGWIVDLVARNGNRRL